VAQHGKVYLVISPLGHRAGVGLEGCNALVGSLSSSICLPDQLERWVGVASPRALRPPFLRASSVFLCPRDLLERWDRGGGVGISAGEMDEELLAKCKFLLDHDQLDELSNKSHTRFPAPVFPPTPRISGRSPPSSPNTAIPQSSPPRPASARAHVKLAAASAAEQWELRKAAKVAEATEAARQRGVMAPQLRSSSKLMDSENLSEMDSEFKRLLMDGEEHAWEHLDKRFMAPQVVYSLYLRLIDSCITQLKAQGPSRTCNESKEEEEEKFILHR